MPSPSPQGPLDPFQHKTVDLFFQDPGRVFRTLIENLHSGVFITDNQFEIYYLNAAFVAMLGYDNKSALLGRSVLDCLFVGGAYREEFIALLNDQGYVKGFEVDTRNRSGERLVGLINANRVFDEQGKPIGVVGVVMDITAKRKLMETLSEERDKMAELLRFDGRLQEVRSMSRLADLVVSQICHILKVRRCSFMLVEQETQQLVLKSFIGLDHETASHIRLNIGEGIAGTAALTKEEIVIDDIEYDPRFKRGNREGYLGRSCVSMPVIWQERVIGVINVADKLGDPPPFSPLDIKILRILVRLTAIAIQNVTLYQKLEQLSFEDELTRVYNHRYFVHALEEEMKRSQRSKRSFSLLMVDLDHFKPINDTLGHMEGDKVLRRVAQIFQQSLRETDKVCRYGGDEFALILPDTDKEAALIVAEKIRHMVEQESWPMPLTVSIGVCGYRDEKSRAELVFKADRALYEAKRAGRNRVVFVE